VTHAPGFTVGVEEEYQIVDAATFELRPRAERLLEAASESVDTGVEPELSLSQVEIGTDICTSLDEVGAELVRLRSTVLHAAESVGSRIVAVATHPFADWIGHGITPKERYLDLADRYQQLAREQLICGCHVHVSVDDRDLAVRAMDRLRPWLPTLLALTGSSAFWQGVDTGYASYRTALFDRWPMTGAPLPLGSRAAYDELVADLVACGAIVDATRLYWDVRPSARFETLELRVADVCTTVDEAVMTAGLARSLVRSAVAASLADDTPVTQPRPELVRAARWRAARYGLDDQLVDLPGRRLVPATVAVDDLLRHLRPDLEEHGEWDVVRALVDGVVAHGTSAQRQRRVFERTGSLREVVAAAAAETARF
jgi:carboxylate-amine ligase